MLSRVADSLYWMGRYLERAENITRLLLVTEDFSTETQGLAEDLAQTAWKDMLEIFPSAADPRGLPGAQRGVPLGGGVRAQGHAGSPRVPRRARNDPQGDLHGRGRDRA